jgi:hypothetical protein
MNHKLATRQFLWFALLAWAQLGSLSLPSRAGGPPTLTPEGHAVNQQRASEADQSNLKRHARDPQMLVLPGLVADRSRRRVEVMVERTRLAPESPCEFTVIAETSDHAYEALLVAFAKPSDVHRALQFIGIEPGAPFDPDGNRFWARGEPCVLRVAGNHQPPLRLEQLLLDRRTGKTLREEGFLFTGSLKTPAISDSQAWVYAADEYQPKSIVSLFNSSHSVLQVPYVAPKSDVYQNTIINPEHELPEGVLLTLVIEPANPDGTQRVKDLSLRVRAGSPAPDQSLTGAARLNSLRLELKDGGTILNAKPNLLTVLETLARLDRKAHACFLTLEFDDDVEVGDAQALARVLASVDSEPGVRIEPPPRGQLYYKAFIPNTSLLNREERIYHPWELSLSEKMGRVQGTLVRIESVWKESSAAPELKSTEVPVAGPAELHQALESEAEGTRRTGSRPRPPVMMVFASRTLAYGALVDFLAPSLATHRAVHVYLDTPMPPLPTPPRTPNPSP